MISSDHFDPAAPMYQVMRFHHECSSKGDKPLVVTRYPHGWSWYCHRCGEKGLRRTDRLSPAEYKLWQRSKNQRVQENRTVKNVELPAGFTRNIPPKGLAWLYSFGITDDDMEYHNMGYSTVLDRVILPVYKAGELVYWQGRSLNPPYIVGKNPKYMNIKAQGRDDVFFWVVDYHTETDRVVLVEDILSSVCVGRASDTIGLLYAYIPDKLVMNLSLSYDEIVFWLDPDKWNRMLSRVNRWRSFGVNVRCIRANEDPKFYDDDEIIEKLEV